MDKELEKKLNQLFEKPKSRDSFKAFFDKSSPEEKKALRLLIDHSYEKGDFSKDRNCDFVEFSKITINETEEGRIIILKGYIHTKEQKIEYNFDKPVYEVLKVRGIKVSKPFDSEKAVNFIKEKLSSETIEESNKNDKKPRNYSFMGYDIRVTLTDKSFFGNEKTYYLYGQDDGDTYYSTGFTEGRMHISRLEGPVSELISRSITITPNQKKIAPDKIYIDDTKIKKSNVKKVENDNTDNSNNNSELNPNYITPPKEYTNSLRKIIDEQSIDDGVYTPPQLETFFPSFDKKDTKPSGIPFALETKPKNLNYSIPDGVNIPWSKGGISIANQDTGDLPESPIPLTETELCQKITEYFYGSNDDRKNFRKDHRMIERIQQTLIDDDYKIKLDGKMKFGGETESAMYKYGLKHGAQKCKVPIVYEDAKEAKRLLDSLEYKKSEIANNFTNNQEFKIRKGLSLT